jgi:alcohol dehydrogenase
MVRDGRLKVVIDRVFPLAEAHKALRMLEDREVFGKIVVAP